MLRCSHHHATIPHFKALGDLVGGVSKVPGLSEMLFSHRLVIRSIKV